MNVGGTFLGSRTWESMRDKRDAMLKNYSEVFCFVFFFEGFGVL